MKFSITLRHLPYLKDFLLIWGAERVWLNIRCAHGHACKSIVTFNFIVLLSAYTIYKLISFRALVELFVELRMNLICFMVQIECILLLPPHHM